MAALAVLQQVRQEGQYAVDHPADHDRKAPVPVVEGVGLDRPADAEASVVEQHMDLAEARLGFGRRRGEGLAVGDVQPDGVDVAAPLPGLEVLERLVDVVLADVGHDHLHARVDHGPGRAEADAGGAAGDEGDLSFDVLHDVWSVRRCVPGPAIYPIRGRGSQSRIRRGAMALRRSGFPAKPAHRQGSEPWPS